jgi:hypothetical protein
MFATCSNLIGDRMARDISAYFASMAVREMRAREKYAAPPVHAPKREPKPLCLLSDEEKRRGHGYADDNGERAKAHYAVRKAIMAGSLIRPKVCEACGDKPGNDIGGKSKIVAHHHRGWKNPLDVLWVCQRCNRRLAILREPGDPEPVFDGSILEGGSYGSPHGRRSNLPQLQYLYDPNHPDRMID